MRWPVLNSSGIVQEKGNKRNEMTSLEFIRYSTGEQGLAEWDDKSWIHRVQYQRKGISGMRWPILNSSGTVPENRDSLKELTAVGFSDSNHFGVWGWNCISFICCPVSWKVHKMFLNLRWWDQIKLTEELCLKLKAARLSDQAGRAQI